MAGFDKRPRPGKKYSGAFDREKKEGSKKSDYKSKRSFTKNKSYREKQGSETREGKAFERKRPFSGKQDSEGGERRFKPRFDDNKREKKPFKKSFGGDKRDFRKDKKDGHFERRDTKWRSSDGPSSTEERGEKRSFEKKRPFRKSYDNEKREYKKDQEDSGFEKRKNKWGNEERPRSEKPEKRRSHRDFEEGRAFEERRPAKEKFFKKSPPAKTGLIAPGPDGLIRLNKYLSNSGVASRREADMLIQSGAVKVNGEVITQLGHKIKPGDNVTYGDQPVKGEKKVYLLLNKPKDYITTVEDPRDRKTVMELIAGACRERIYPVGRLDRNTTGLLLLTNDGELTTKLTHPKFGVKKVYQVSLNKGLKVEDFRAITEGVELEDGPVKADDLAFVGEGKKEVGIEIHSGRNRIVRRLFEQLGYEVLKLDRVVFAGLTKKDLPRGKWRFLSPKEVAFLKMLG